MSIMDDTTWKQHLSELYAYDRWVCDDCGFNYIVVDDLGLMNYCSVRDIHEHEMKKIKSCELYRYLESKY